VGDLAGRGRDQVELAVADLVDHPLGGDRDRLRLVGVADVPDSPLPDQERERPNGIRDVEPRARGVLVDGERLARERVADERRQRAAAVARPLARAVELVEACDRQVLGRQVEPQRLFAPAL
jgi:hypothetical protein